MAPSGPPNALGEVEIITFLLSIVKAKDTVVNYNTVEEELGITANATKKRLKRIEIKYGKKPDNTADPSRSKTESSRNKTKDEDDNDNDDDDDAEDGDDKESKLVTVATKAAATPAKSASKKRVASAPTIKEPGSPTPAPRKKAKKGGNEVVKNESESI